MSETPPPSVSSTVRYYRPLPEWVPSPPKQRYWLHLLLLLATCFTTLVMGARMQYNFQHDRPALSFSDEPIVDLSGQRETIPFFLPYGCAPILRGCWVDCPSWPH